MENNSITTWDEIISLFRKAPEQVHPGELAKVLDELPEDVLLQSFSELDREVQPVVFTYLDTQVQDEVIEGMSNEAAAYLLDHLESDDRMNFFHNLMPALRGRYLGLLNEKNRTVTQDLLGYPADSVARIINTDFATITADMTIEQAFDRLRRLHRDTEAINTIYIEDDAGRLVDDMPLRRLVLNAPHKKIADIMDHNYEALNIKDTKETAVNKFKEYDRITLPVVNDDNIMLGIITVDDILDVMEQKDTAEVQKFGGMEELDYPYFKTPFFSLIQKRAGWLIVLFLGEMFTATAMAHFEEEIASAVVLALFIPLVISSGGNSGSQAATLIIRAMALKEITIRHWWYVMRREVLSGLLLGVILGAIGFFRILLWQKMHWFNYGDHWLLLAFTIFCSLIGIVMWGTLSGSMIPIFLKKMKIDPATSSAPFVATMVDVTGLIIYFSIAAFILKGSLL